LIVINHQVFISILIVFMKHLITDVSGLIARHIELREHPSVFVNKAMMSIG
jgi:hypothetical protein